jgi:signal recognition particle receptor subunit beta
VACKCGDGQKEKWKVEKCIDFMDRNKCCLKDDFPLIGINKIDSNLSNSVESVRKVVAYDYREHICVM